MTKSRADIEARRGIVRDENGRIVRDKDFHKDAITRLKAKVDEYDSRKENALAQIEEHKTAIKNFGRNTTSASKKTA